MFELIRPGTKFDFVGKRYLWAGLSVLAMLGTLILLFTKGLNYGIDFTGGAEVQIRTPATWEIDNVRKEMEAGGLNHVKVQQIGEPAAHQFLLKTQGDESTLNTIAQKVTGVLNKSFKPGEYEIQRVDVVGPAAGSSLRMSGFLSMFYALLCILLYVTIRFDYRYSPGAVLALAHDSLITVGVFILTQKQFDLQILAALLALIGYSNNDTIIVYDRVRETLHAHPELKIEQAVNRAINETLGRTILTSLCTFFTVFALWALGGKVIEDFAFTLMVGIVVGAYSSIFIASSIVIMISHYDEKRIAKAKATGSYGQSKKKRQVMVRPEPKMQ
jgi:preprotein translocase subunit SecF